ncbi:Tn3 family transposase [Parasedimentitalea maritima]|uniref:Tn3 family transposase n=1 Tax=Parasedimentitalea maritima TaxID=2578117 RepID=UPI001FE3B735|nr:Tn3 family transposase [Zongyanglinia marina]
MLDDLFSASDDQNRYRLTLLKKLSQSTNPSRIKDAVVDFQVLSELHDRLAAILAKLDLGTAGIQYFAGSVLRSEIFQMQHRERNDRHIHAAAFVAHQFYRCQDNMIDLWLSVMASFKSAAARDYQETLVQERKDQQRQIGIVVEGLETSVFGVLRNIRGVMAAANLSDAQKVTATQTLLNQSKTDDFDQLKNDLAATASEAGWHDILEARSVKLQNRLSPLLRALSFMPNKRAIALLEAIDHFRNDGEMSAAHAPMGFLDVAQKDALVRGDGSFRVSLYKVFLFQAVTTAIKSGNLNVEQSYKYRPMDAYLIDRSRWHREKARLLERAGLTELADPEPVLTRPNVALTAEYWATNDRAAGNLHLKLRKDGTFHIATPALDARDSDPLGDLFPQRHDVALAQVLETVNNHCNMLRSFEHWQQTHVRQATIRDNWDDLLRLVATIKPKDNTASDIFRRLNSYSRQHTLYQTMKAFGQIIKSLFILRYVDDLALRQAIEKQLNKVELANRFTRAVAIGNPREYTQTEKKEQEIAEACNCLIRNAIICWNYLYLARQVEKAPDPEARETLLRLIAAHSPMSWAHINMLGEYDFSEEKLRDTLGILPPKMAA